VYNADNPNNIIHETSKRSNIIKCEYFQGKLNNLETNTKNKNIRDLCRGISGLKKFSSPVLTW
jgi:hypothetical protein